MVNTLMAINLCDELSSMIRTGKTPKRRVLEELADQIRGVMSLEKDVTLWRQRYEAKCRELESLRAELTLLKRVL